MNRTAEDKLRGQVVRLAHNKPEMQILLLPLLQKEAAEGLDLGKEMADALQKISPEELAKISKAFEKKKKEFEAKKGKQAKTLAQTPDAAKEMHKRYMDKHPASKKGPEDFLDPSAGKGGEKKEEKGKGDGKSLAEAHAAVKSATPEEKSIFSKAFNKIPAVMAANKAISVAGPKIEKLVKENPAKARDFAQWVGVSASIGIMGGAATLGGLAPPFGSLVAGAGSIPAAAVASNIIQKHLYGKIDTLVGDAGKGGKKASDEDVLKGQVIRLAHANPELQPILLPLLDD